VQCQSGSPCCELSTEYGVDLAGYGRVPCCPPCAEVMGAEPRPLIPSRLVESWGVVHAQCPPPLPRLSVRLASDVEVADAVTCASCRQPLSGVADCEAARQRGELTRAADAAQVTVDRLTLALAVTNPDDAPVVDALTEQLVDATAALDTAQGDLSATP
jgi:hypothetical protein